MSKDNYYLKILEAVSEVAIIAYTDTAGRITYANKNFCNISGYTMQELYNKDHRILNSGFHPSGFFKKMYETARKGHVWRGEIRNKKKDGSFYWVDTQIIPIMGESGHIESYASIRFDITERKNLEEAHFVIEKMAGRIEIAKQIAHEINNPLTIIELCCLSLNRELNESLPNIKMRKKIFKIIEQSRRIALIVKELKYYSSKEENIKIAV